MLSDIIPILPFVLLYLVAGYLTAWILFHIVPWGIVRAILLIPGLLLLSVGGALLLSLALPNLAGIGGLGLVVAAIPGLPSALALSIFLLREWDKNARIPDTETNKK